MSSHKRSAALLDGVRTYLEIFAPGTAKDIALALNVKANTVCRYLVLLKAAGVPVRIAAWRRTGNVYAQTYGLGPEPDAPRVGTNRAARRAERRLQRQRVALVAKVQQVREQEDVEVWMTNENKRKAAAIQPRRDPYIAMLFGP